VPLPPLPPSPRVLDPGCGPGRHTPILVRELRTPIIAVDLHAPFLAHLKRDAGAAGLAHLVITLATVASVTSATFSTCCARPTESRCRSAE